MGKRTEGITLVELCIAIAVLATVAALAWPSWGHSGTAARQAKLEQARGRIEKAIEGVHALAQSQGEQAARDCAQPGFGPNPPTLNAAGNGNVCGEHARVEVTHGYPAATMAGIVTAAGLVSGEGSPTTEQLRTAGFEASAVAFGLRLRVTGAPEPDGCQLIYVPPAARGQPPAVAGVASHGC